MVEFGVLSAIRSCLAEEGIGEAYGLSADRIYVMTPQGQIAKSPVVILDLEETWMPSASGHPDFGKVTLKISILSDSHDGSESLEIAKQICQRLDGATLAVEGPCEATLRMGSSVLDMKKVQDSPRRVEQYYEALVHRSRFRRTPRTKTTNDSPLVTVCHQNTQKPASSTQSSEPRSTPETP